MPKFDVFMTATATLGVTIEAATAEEAEAIAQRDLYGPAHAMGVDFDAWDIAVGQTERHGPPSPTPPGELPDPGTVPEWVPDHIKAKRHHEWRMAQRKAQGTSARVDPS